jgi:hypothetical protein
VSTTAVFAEILATGVQSTVLVFLALAAIVDIGPMIAGAQGWEAAITIVLLASAYILGVVTDRVADSLVTPLRNRVSEHDTGERAAMRRRVLQTASPLSNFLEYQRSRMRLMRGAILNLLLAVPVTTLLLLSRGPEEPMGAVVAATAVLLVLAAACLYSFLEIVKAQDKWLNIIANPEPTATKVA